MLENLKIITKLIILIAVMALSILAIGIVGFYGIASEIKSVDEVYLGGVEQMQMLSTIKGMYNKIITAPLKVITGQSSFIQGIDSVKETKHTIDDQWTKYLKSEDEHPGEQRKLIEQIQLQIDELKPGIDKLQEILKQGNNEALQAFLKQFEPQAELIVNTLPQLINWHAEDTKHDYQLGKENGYWNKLIIVFSSALALLIAIPLGLLISLSITRPIKKAVAIIDRLTVGDLSAHIENPYSGVISKLLDAMRSLTSSSKEMSDTLLAISNGDLTVSVQKRSDQDILGLSLETMIKNLKHIIGEIQGEIAVLNTSSQEIVGTVAQVANSSAETAAAITETTTSVEELKQTAHISNEKAKDVLLCAEETQQVLDANDKSLHATLDDMSQIHEKMRIISTGIVKLSEHSQAIGEIIDTVNDLAEQSNLLAVNAAIEAAKAGEHGKGFSVVAQEIRTLAEQSKSATVQVRSILSDIQNSTSSAVLATEQGLKAVEKGVNQSSQTSASMKLLTQSIFHVAQAANQIALTSQQQLTGVDQVTVAMNNISEAAIQHADHMKQIEAAVISLNSVGANLRELINQYKLAREQMKNPQKKVQHSLESEDYYYNKEKPEHKILT